MLIADELFADPDEQKKWRYQPTWGHRQLRQLNHHAKKQGLNQIYNPFLTHPPYHRQPR